MKKIQFATDFILAVSSVVIPLILLIIKRQTEEYREKEEQMKYFGKLYQYFTDESFRTKRKNGWLVLTRAIINPDYAELLVSKSYVSKYIDELHSYHSDREKKIYQSFYMDKEKTFSIEKEHDMEHMLDDVINFFKILSDLDFSKISTKKIDFYYDSWRPILYWYALKLEEAYKAYKINELYNNPPNLRECLEKLDRNLAFFLIIKHSEEIEKHPIIVGIKNRGTKI